MITVKHTGEFKNTFQLLKNSLLLKFKIEEIMNRYGAMGVQALSSATPVSTGLTAGSWHYTIQNERNRKVIIWSNSNVNKGVSIAVILQYGHGTRNGGYVQGRDYINPAMRPVFDTLVKEIWEEVLRL